VTHAQLGAYLLGLWGVPDPVVEAVAMQHEALPAERINVNAVVHLGVWLVESQSGRFTASPEPDPKWLAALNLGKDLSQLREEMQAILQDAAA
jgi:HD-like signal output (HDOD) protein